MTFQELRERYARLCDEIEALDGAGDASRARVAQLTLELDEIDEALAALKRLVSSAPTLRDVIPWAPPVHRPQGVERRAVARRLTPSSRAA